MSRLAAITATRGLGFIDQWAWRLGFGASGLGRGPRLRFHADVGRPAKAGRYIEIEIGLGEINRRAIAPREDQGHRTKDIEPRTDQGPRTKDGPRTKHQVPSTKRSRASGCENRPSNNRRPLGARHARGAFAAERPIEEALAPKLERDDGPELKADVAPALVEPQQLLEVSHVEQASLPAAIREQQITRKRRQLSPEPRGERHGKAMFGTVDDVVWKNAAHRLFEEVLRGAAMQTQTRGQLRRKLDDVMIEQWRPCLDRVRHRHAIDFGQDVERQVVIEVAVLGGGDPVAAVFAKVRQRRGPRIAG